MFFKEWNVLVVDDEPDVLTVTKLALRDVRVYGLPVKIHTAKSKMEAMQLLNGPLRMQGTSQPIVAVALVDVVMESDTAGLELCNYIRNQINGHSVQLFIRTGQPGVAPERQIIDDYDISGYFTKVELTEQKLYTLVKTGIRQWFSIWYALTTLDQTNRLITHSASRRSFFDAIGWLGEPGPQEGELPSGFKFDNQLVVSDYPDKIQPLHDHLNGLKPVIKTPEGHKLIMDTKGNLMVKIAKSNTTADYYYVAESTMVMPRILLDLTFRSGLVFSTLWKKITDEEKRVAAVKPAPAKRVPKPAQKVTKKVAKPAKKVVKKVAKKLAKKAVKRLVKKAVKKPTTSSTKRKKSRK